MTGRRSGLLLLLPCAAVLVFLFYLPQVFMLLVSLRTAVTYGAVIYGSSVANYLRALDPLYLSILGRSLLLALETTAICLLLAYPVAYWLGVSCRPVGAISW